MTTYRIVRFFQDEKIGKMTLFTGLTLAEAQARLADRETSSATATSRDALMWTRSRGPWFDGYEKEDYISGRPA